MALFILFFCRLFPIRRLAVDCDFLAGLLVKNRSVVHDDAHINQRLGHMGGIFKGIHLHQNVTAGQGQQIGDLVVVSVDIIQPF